MFCPACRTEYRDRFFECADCQADLIDTLPEEPEPGFVEFKEVIATYNPADIAFLKSLLDAEGIQYFFKGEHFMYVRPLADPVRLMVRTDQAAVVLDMLKEVNLSVTGINLDRKGE